MGISEEVGSAFTETTRRLGEALVERVYPMPRGLGDLPWRGVVAGKVVQFDGSAGLCTCAKSERREPCEHLWALVLALDAAIEGDFDDELELGSGRSEFSSPVTSRSVGRNTGRGTSTSFESLQQHGRLRELLSRVRTHDLPRVELLTEALRQVHYVLGKGVVGTENVMVTFGARQRLSNGQWSVLKPVEQVAARGWRPPDADAEVLRRIDDLNPYGYASEVRTVSVPVRDIQGHLEAWARAGQLFACQLPWANRAKDQDLVPVVVGDEVDRAHFAGEIEIRAVGAKTVPADSPRGPRQGGGRGGPARPIVVEVPGDPTVGGKLALDLVLRGADGEVLARNEVHSVVGHYVIHGDRLLRWRSELPDLLVTELLENGPVVVDAEQRVALESLLAPPEPIEVAPGLVPQLRLRESLDTKQHGRVVRGNLTFRYDLADEDGDAVRAESGDPLVRLDGEVLARDVAAERRALDAFVALGGVLQAEGEFHAGLPARDLVGCVRRLVDVGFEVFAAHDRVRAVGAPRVQVASGIDWFEVSAQSGEQETHGMALPRLLRAVADKKGYVRLGVGEVGLFDPEAMGALARLSEIGKVDGETIRFSKSQGFLLDALLQAREGEVSVDKQFARLQERSRRGLTAKARNEPAGFGTELRPYQREGLGWFRFLNELGVGGCLADDMGLGKTVQVLALLEQQRRRRPGPGPSLVVAPRSLVFHWAREAQRFAPKLRVAEFVGGGRHGALKDELAEGFAQRDLVLTTYGTLRNDVGRFEHIEWNYVILDEAQAIKNASSQASKAVRVCRAKNRLALSGTPIENHLGELWALFEFLNPGMLGASKTFRKLVSEGIRPAAAGDADGPTDGVEREKMISFRDTLRTAVRPFLLRRTKEQVLTELPPKTIQVLDCELPTAQRKLYDELREHYRAALLGQLDESKVPDNMRFQVLEALLRLRQASCHPGLLDDNRQGEACAKFDVLLPMLEELRSEGHKALVFSQFPSFLRLLRDRLDKKKVAYAYLDGKTRKRSDQVDRFQNDDGCSLFLISLKAGGHGLNLTAASYVFLLDPWWNPAVEAQAIDRAHRMGQTQMVNAYRLLCTGTVEERVAELQASKRALAESVLGNEDSVLQGLTGNDIAALLK